MALSRNVEFLEVDAAVEGNDSVQQIRNKNTVQTEKRTIYGWRTLSLMIRVYLGLLGLFMLASRLPGLDLTMATIVISPAVVALIFLVTGLSESDHL